MDMNVGLLDHYNVSTRKLSETGLFSDTAKLTPEKGLIPYSVNAELWSDGATKRRWPF